jgi:hypothetical protein
MAGRTRQKDVVIPTTALVASAVRYAGDAARIYQPRQDWQEECYRHFAICGEARFAARFFGHALSRATLHIVKKVKNELVRQENGPAVEALDALFNGDDGQAQMLDAIGVHLTIAGECWLIGREVDGVDVWEVISILELSVQGKNWTIKYADDSLQDVQLKDSDVAIRIWRPFPGKRIEADSPFRSLLPVLSEIEWATRHIFKQLSSRLAGAGLLMLPQEMTFPPPPEVDGKPVVISNEAEGFMLTLADTMMAMEDDSSMAGYVPIIVTAPGDSIDKARLMHFWSELDEKAMAIRSNNVHRFALGMDLPPEQVEGMSSNVGTGGGNSNGVSHWGAWQIEESTIKMHVEPMLLLVCNAVTVGYIRPAVAPSPGDVVPEQVWFDTSALRLRPDRSKEALELYDRGLIRGEVAVRENGFSVDDMPDADELKQWLLIKVAMGSATPEQVGAALNALGVAVPVPALPAAPTREARPDPTLIDHPTRPRTPAESNAVLLAACEPLALRALERAGNRLRNSGMKPPGVPSYETHCHVKANGATAALLEDAFTTCPQVLAGIADETVVTPVLQSYVSTLLAEQAPHTRERLAHWLELGVPS